MNTLRFRLTIVSFLGLHACSLVLVTGLLPASAFAQTVFTWQQIKDKFAAANPTLKAAQLNIDESRAAEITAYLRPNPSLNVSTDGFQVTPGVQGIWRPLSGIVVQPGISYLHERDQKRELRRERPSVKSAIFDRMQEADWAPFRNLAPDPWPKVQTLLNAA